jgi:hypothetical protein
MWAESLIPRREEPVKSSPCLLFLLFWSPVPCHPRINIYVYNLIITTMKCLAWLYRLSHSIFRLHGVASLKLRTRVGYFTQYYKLLFCVEALCRSASVDLVLKQSDLIRNIICSLDLLFWKNWERLMRSPCCLSAYPSVCIPPAFFLACVWIPLVFYGLCPLIFVRSLMR